MTGAARSVKRLRQDTLHASLRYIYYTVPVGFVKERR